MAFLDVTKTKNYDLALATLKEAWNELAQNKTFNKEKCPVEISILTHFILAKFAQLAGENATVCNLAVKSVHSLSSPIVVG